MSQLTKCRAGPYQTMDNLEHITGIIEQPLSQNFGETHRSNSANLKIWGMKATTLIYPAFKLRHEVWKIAVRTYRSTRSFHRRPMHFCILNAASCSN